MMKQTPPPIAWYFRSWRLRLQVTIAILFLFQGCSYLRFINQQGRLKKAQDLSPSQKNRLQIIDYEKYFYGQGVSVIEWADKIKELLPEEYLEIRIAYGPDNERKFEFCPVGERFAELIKGCKF